MKSKEWEDGYNTGILEGLTRADEIITKKWEELMNEWHNIDWGKIEEKVKEGKCL